MLLRKLDTRFGYKTLWQLIKFNLVSFSITVLQLTLANLLPLIFDSVSAKLPPFLSPVFRPETLFKGPSPYSGGVLLLCYRLAPSPHIHYNSCSGTKLLVRRLSYDVSPAARVRRGAAVRVHP